MPAVKPPLLMIHGVNSTLEWKGSARRALGQYFDCVPVRYRYYHTMLGPFKVYFYMTSFWLLLTFFLLLFAKYGSSQTFVWWATLVPLCFLGWVAAKGEYDWAKLVVSHEFRWHRSMLWLPVGWTILGIICLLLAPFDFGGLACFVPFAAMLASSLFLDFREYTATIFKDPIRGMTVCIFGLLFFGLPLIATASFYGLELKAQLTAIVATVAIGLIEPRIRQNLSLNLVSQRLNEAASEYPHPFVVSHSLGTFLLGNVLLESELRNGTKSRLGRVIMTGCVLQAKFPWSGFVHPTFPRIWSVINYVGPLDFVPYLTGAIRRLWVTLTFVPFRLLMDFERVEKWAGVRPLGNAGISGFVESQFVHFRNNGPCEQCQNSIARVHNVSVGLASHNSINRSELFQKWNWLPELWGWNDHEFSEWIAICRNGFRHFQNSLEPNSTTHRILFREQSEADADGLDVAD